MLNIWDRWNNHGIEFHSVPTKYLLTFAKIHYKKPKIPNGTCFLKLGLNFLWI